MHGELLITPRLGDGIARDNLPSRERSSRHVEQNWHRAVVARHPNRSREVSLVILRRHSDGRVRGRLLDFLLAELWQSAKQRQVQKQAAGA